MTKYAFNVMPGMVLPTGTSVSATTIHNGSLQRLLAPNLDRSHHRHRAAVWPAIPYFPATYLAAHGMPEPVTAACVAGTRLQCPRTRQINPERLLRQRRPMAQGKLRRYEIKAGQQLSQRRRNYDEEMKNFANWWHVLPQAQADAGRFDGPCAGATDRPAHGRGQAFCDNSSRGPCIAPTMYDTDALDSPPPTA